MKANRTISSLVIAAGRRACAMVAMCLLLFAAMGCEREPPLHLHHGGTDITTDVPVVDLDLNVIWDYLFAYDTEYDWQAEWLYGWDDTDIALSGKIGYTEPQSFNIRRYYNATSPLAPHTSPFRNHIEGKFLSAKYDFGFWDILAWNDILTSDGIQSIRIDEETTYDYVTAYTGQSMIPAMYSAPRYTRAFYQPEELFAGYEKGLEINSNLDGFTFDPERNCWVKHLDMTLQPVTYIYLVQVILHNNNRAGRKVTGIDGVSNFSGMARSVNLNTGVTGSEAITVNYNVRMKFDRKTQKQETVDIIGGKLLTFGIPNLNPYKLSTRAYSESLAKVEAADKGNHHYVDVTMQFQNGKDSTLVFDVTNQVRRLYRGGVITIDVDMDKVPLPYRSGGSAFDATVKDFEERQWEFDM